jgi:hypothetical protein
MTTGAGGLVSRRRIIDNFGIGLVAASAVEIAAVIEWLVSQPDVAVIRLRPGGRVMAQVTLLLRIEVIRILPCSDYTVVT